MSEFDLRDTAPGYGGVRMDATDRIALASAADRERVRLLRKPWWESVWLRVAAVGAVVAACAEVYSALHHG